MYHFIKPPAMKFINLPLTLPKTFAIFLLAALLLTAESADAKAEWPWWPFKINRFDKEGRFHGRWKVFLGEGKDRVMIRNGRFKHGKEIGKWRYYYPSGALYIYEEHKRYENVYIMKRYHENGNLMKEGQAMTVNNGKGVKYFWIGEWKVYNEQGEYTHTEVYRDGSLVAKR